MSKFRNLLVCTALASLAAAPALAEKLGLGRPALPEEIAAWDVDVSPDGAGLPPGSGSVADGEVLFSENCAVCHGEFAEGVDNWPKLAGGDGTLAREDPLKTVGSYWPYLSTVWDYVHRTMPFGGAQTLSDDEVYAIVAYILYSNYLVDDEFVLSQENFLEVEMPNAGGFIVDDRDGVEVPRFSQPPCMNDCKDSVGITMRAAVLDVTPDETAAGETASEAVQVAVAETTVPAAASAPDPALVAQGEKVFRECAACHRIGEGATHRVGPILTGVYMRAAAQAEGFRYSPAMTEAGEGGLLWDQTTLDAYLERPADVVPRGRMSFRGLSEPGDREAVIAYLRSFSE
ncbi:sulfur dehydrogenase subunit SoxD [Rhodovulum imhoffii]|uniref:Sulfur dehydrogenase subunit SoxD n=1 Tax=Rhodovulum imhoffii TaxID=365340 RepID=A0A2T5BPT5_9RHOB|nr:c-type cytochrome [Rhodovulum imhoffii]MBK5933062.1 MFS transporter [Rhodovulum imhoffii]PTN01082.1 sulfur dehydrogenase subunit SoxD [Rhodovulum imhoffii]